MMAVINPAIAPNRILFAMLRVSDLDTSIAFYRDMLGMIEIRRETFEDAKFTAVYMGYDEQEDDTIVELTHNWENDGYELGTAFGNITLAVKDVYAVEAFLKEQDVKILRPAGELSIVPSETGKKYILAHIADPDGYRIELIQD
ncbi:MAG: VOC family protein [Parasphingorhabdus sp.]|uniref:VOC family protein n=1 Tax=Parasphingorhabdus sp. TaxID=2709688 RepID=UPI003296EA89